MPTQYPCTFSIDINEIDGGRLTGGFAASTPKPKLQNGDSILVSVTCDEITAGNGLTGVFVFTASQDANSNQTTPSPFLRGAANSNFVCVQQLPGSQPNQGGQVTITFPAWTYRGGQQGSYELTFIAWNQQTNQQWSEDPEFETGS